MSEGEGLARDIDWEAISLDYRAGVKTLRAIADEHGVSHGAINKRAKRDHWVRDLAPRIQRQAGALVSRLAVRDEVSKESLDTEQGVVDANAQMVADVLLAHRVDIKRNRGIVTRLTSELEQITGPEAAADLARLGEIISSGDTDKAAEAYAKITSLPERARVAKLLADTLRTTIDLERQALGVDRITDQQPDDPLGALLARVIDSGTTVMVSRDGGRHCV